MKPILIPAAFRLFVRTTVLRVTLAALAAALIAPAISAAAVSDRQDEIAAAPPSGSILPIQPTQPRSSRP